MMMMMLLQINKYQFDFFPVMDHMAWNCPYVNFGVHGPLNRKAVTQLVTAIKDIQ